MACNVVVAAGIIIFRRVEYEIQYLLLKASYGTKHWSPPKGHVDPGESEFETAIRETAEESGFSKDALNIIENYQQVLNYDVGGKPKRVVYWLAELKNPEQPVMLSDEHTEHRWLVLNDACETAKYKDIQEVFHKIDQYLNQKV